MILSDRRLLQLCEEGLLTPWDPALINPASIDVRLGGHVLIEERFGDGFELTSLENSSQERPFLLRPGEFILAQTLEEFNVPDNIAIQFALKSSRAREGLQHMLAGFIDPGFHKSTLTLELKNVRSNYWVPIWPGMRIGQLIVTELNETPMRSYRETGRYNNCPLVRGSADQMDTTNKAASTLPGLWR
jgi:dCTP deaminase